MNQYIFLFVLFTCRFASAEEFQLCDVNNVVINDVEQKDCPEDLYLLFKPESCIPTCEKVISKKKVVCDEIPCIPGYKCADDSKRNYCILDETNCFKYYNKLEKDDSNPYYNAYWQPKCERDGTWKHVQLKGDEANGRFFCYSDDGTKLYGHAFSGGEENMTCACSRRRHQLEKRYQQEKEKYQRNWFVSLHCDLLGNYEPLQCNSGQCWCAEAKTGRLTSQMVPESAKHLLPCYTERLVGTQYLRQCESQLYAQSLILRELEIHGTTEIEFNQLTCDLDGSYGPLKIQNGQAYCAWKNNTNLGPFTASTTKGMNCNCARDTELFRLNVMEQKLTCNSNGNYMPHQITSKHQYYCVDEDGFQNAADLYETVEQAYEACQKMVTRGNQPL